MVAGLLEFVARSPTPYHATENLAGLLQENGFTALDESEAWALEPGGKYYVVRGGASLLAFVYGEQAVEQTGVRIIGAHTDSPCLKVKPNPEMLRRQYYQLGVEVYGGVLLNPWFDRDLSIAGKVSYIATDGQLKSALVDFQRPVAVVPSLAIHLNREVNSNKSVNPQKEMNAILFQSEDTVPFRELLSEQVAAGDVREILDFNLSFYDTQPPAVVGLKNEFIASARLDNLMSCYLGARAIMSAAIGHTSVLICNDHEEVGSCSDIGAQGPLLDEILDRLAPEPQQRQRALRRSVMCSVDNAHGVHPNYQQHHDEQHGPLINGGPVIKFDANQSYATGSASAALVRWLARLDSQPEIPLQNYVTRADMRCGSTIGPLTAAGVGVTTVDLGLPTFAMHSVRELGGTRDLEHMLELLRRFLRQDQLPPLA